MNYTQNKKIMSITERILVIGIDIAKEDHYAEYYVLLIKRFLSMTWLDYNVFLLLS
jgi:hypothetical protein